MRLVIKEVRNQIIEFVRSGRAVKVEGLETDAPTISLAGTLDLQYPFNNGLNVPGIFSGTILNREFIGKTSDDLGAKWNEV